MTGDPLYQPLGVRPQPRRRWIGISLSAALVILGGLVGALWYSHSRSEDRNDVAVAPIEPLAKPVPPVAPPAPASTAAAAPSAGPQSLPNGDTVEIQHGVKIIRMGAARQMPGVTVSAASDAAHPDMSLQPAPDPQLVEHSPFGDLPRIGPNGERPAAAYARPIRAMPLTEAEAPRIAILVGDLGNNAAASDLLVSALPPDVSLAFRPDGPDIAAQVARARQAGHEVLLELPDASLSQDRAAAAGSAPIPLDTAHRFMTAFPGYVGLTMPIGTSLPADGKALIEDARSRGLLFIDGATALEDPKAASLGLQSARPDVAIDGQLAKASIDSALAQLESVARIKRSAIAYVGNVSQPDDLAAFAAGLKAKGIVLVPVTALAQSGFAPMADETNR